MISRIHIWSWYVSFQHCHRYRRRFLARSQSDAIDWFRPPLSSHHATSMRFVKRDQYIEPHIHIPFWCGSVEIFRIWLYFILYESPNSRFMFIAYKCILILLTWLKSDILVVRCLLGHLLIISPICWKVARIIIIFHLFLVVPHLSIIAFYFVFLLSLIGVEK